MLKVYRVEYYVSVDGGEWREVEGESYRMRDDKEPTSKDIIPTMTFTEFYKCIQTLPLFGVNYGKNILGTPYVEIMYNWRWESWERYYKFKTISYKCIFKEYTKMTLAEIFKKFPADKCIQYLKERGITTCPMNF